MRVIINQNTYDLPENSLVQDALKLIEAAPPYAVAVNLQFVPKIQYSEVILRESDRVEVIAPVTGG